MYEKRTTRILSLIEEAAAAANAPCLTGFDGYSVIVLLFQFFKFSIYKRVFLLRVCNSFSRCGYFLNEL
jgi:hypothetical protein